MTKQLQCNSCGGKYPDTRDGKTATYFHVCPEEVIETHAVCDEKGNVITPAKYKRLENPRNENFKPHPDKPGEYVMISEGSGVTEIA